MFGRKFCMALVACCVATSGHAFAGDYIVSYALDAGGLNDSGTIHDCKYGQSCVIKSEKLDLSISVDIYFPRRRTQKLIGIFAYGEKDRPDCCFFWDGESSAHFELQETFVKLGLYEGRARKRDEFVVNAPLGVLYLQFSDMK